MWKRHQERTSIFVSYSVCTGYAWQNREQPRGSIMFQSVVTQAKTMKTRDVVVIVLLVIETVLVTTAIIPPQIWTRLLPASTNSTLNGPFPASVAPIIAALLYCIPAVIGFSCRSWQRALLLATLPAWLGLGAFVIAAT